MLERSLANLAATACTLALAVPALASAEEGEKPNIFDADIGNFVVTLIIFGLVVYLLGRLAWRPLLNVLQEREATIRDSQEAARRARQQAAQDRATAEAERARARQEASEIVAEGRRDANELGQRLKDEARQEAERTRTRAQREIQLAADSARKELHDEVSDLAVQVAGRILRKELSVEDHRALVAEALRDMEAAGPDGAGRQGS